MPQREFSLARGVLCLGLSILLASCGVAPRTTPLHSRADADAAEVEALNPQESLRHARGRISRARRAFKAGKVDLAIAEVDLASDILATVEIDPERRPGLFERLVELLRLLEQTRREVVPSKALVSGEDAPALALIQSLDQNDLESLSPEDVQQALLIQKIARTCDVTVDCTPAVMRSIRFLTTDARKLTTTWLSRAATYAPMIRSIFEEEGLPRDLAYLPTVESSYNPLAISSAQAVGMWQFVSDTARLFGLRIDDWVDERRDPEKSTRAAARYLKFLYERQGDWRLALASYNWGRLNVERAIEEARSRNFWDLKKIPRETRNYVPLFMSAVIIARSPETFGFQDVKPGAAWHYDPLPLTSPVDLRVAAECAGASYQTLRALNPALRWSVTPPSGRYVLRLPPGTRERFIKKYAALPSGRRTVWHGYRVRQGETLSGIAACYGVPVDLLARANDLRSQRARNRLRVGQRLLVPLFIRTGKRVATAGGPSRRLRYYTVRRGDTLWRISRRHGVEVSQVLVWNHLRKASVIRPGDRLKIWMKR